MNSKRSNRRQFLQRAAAAAGLAAGAAGSAGPTSAQSRGVAAKPEAKPILAAASRFPVSGLEV